MFEILGLKEVELQPFRNGRNIRGKMERWGAETARGKVPDNVNWWLEGLR